MRIVKSFILRTLSLSLFFCLAACGTLLPEIEYVVVTATPGPNELIIRATFTPLPEAEAQVLPSVSEVAITNTPTIEAQNAIPRPIRGEIYIAEQEFEHARMFWLEPAARKESIWILFSDGPTDDVGDWVVYEDRFEEGEISSDPSILPPEGKFQPIRGFGKLWRQEDELRNRVGWALADEVGYSTDYHYEFGGEVVADQYIAAPGVHYLTNLEGITFRLDESDFTWSILEE